MDDIGIQSSGIIHAMDESSTMLETEDHDIRQLKAHYEFDWTSLSQDNFPNVHEENALSNQKQDQTRKETIIIEQPAHTITSEWHNANTTVVDCNDEEILQSRSSLPERTFNSPIAGRPSRTMKIKTNSCIDELIVNHMHEMSADFLNHYEGMTLGEQFDNNSASTFQNRVAPPAIQQQLSEFDACYSNIIVQYRTNSFLAEIKKSDLLQFKSCIKIPNARGVYELDLNMFSSFEKMTLDEHAQRVKNTSNAGGSSKESEVLAMEVCSRCFNAVLIKTESEVQYVKRGPMTDFVAEIGGTKVAVSVTRAMEPGGELSEEDVKKILNKKLRGIQMSNENKEKNEWDTQILLVFVCSRSEANKVKKVLANANVVVLIVTVPDRAKETLLGQQTRKKPLLFSLLIHGLEESEQTNELSADFACQAVNKLLGEKFHTQEFADAHRIGKKQSGKTRPLLIKLLHESVHRNILVRSRALKGSNYRITNALMSKKNNSKMNKNRSAFLREALDSK